MTERSSPSSSEQDAAESVASLRAELARRGYVADRGLASALFLARRLQRPLFLEGQPGVGKTEAAKALAGATGARLIRLQCHEGIDVHQALYDWNHARQMIYIRALEHDVPPSSEVVKEVFGPDFLVRRPLLDALECVEPAVLLIDEIDRADDEFEAFLLELLSDFQITIPEIGTIRAQERPTVILTSNRTRDVHDALKRRCLYHWIDYPDSQRELEILRARVPDVPEALAKQLCGTIERLRELELRKPPGVGETLDWAAALAALGFDQLDDEAVRESLGAVLKVREDQEEVLTELGLSDSDES